MNPLITLPRKTSSNGHIFVDVGRSGKFNVGFRPYVMFVDKKLLVGYEMRITLSTGAIVTETFEGEVVRWFETTNFQNITSDYVSHTTGVLVEEKKQYKYTGLAFFRQYETPVMAIIDNFNNVVLGGLMDAPLTPDVVMLLLSDMLTEIHTVIRHPLVGEQDTHMGNWNTDDEEYSH